jgi:hypothetical protein
MDLERVPTEEVDMPALQAQHRSHGYLPTSLKAWWVLPVRWE